MILSRVRFSTCTAAGVVVWAAAVAHAAPMDQGFTYQGQVKVDSSPLTGTADFQFTLFDALVAGNQIGTQTVTNVAVDNGLFTVNLNAAGEMGAAAFDGNARWIEIAVRSPAGAGGYTTLTPRQPLKAAPYAAYALTAANGGVLTIDNGSPGVMWTRSPNGTDVFLAGSTLAGLGYSSPTARLHVRAPAGLPAETSRFEDVFGRSQLRVATPESAGRAELQAWNGQTDSAGALSLNVAGGNVGIGTASPNSSFRLQLTGGTGVWRGAVAATGTTNSTVMGELSGVATIGGHNAALSAWANLAINPAGGNVGVGTASPTSRLDVAGTFETDAFKLNGNGAALGRVLTSDANGNGTWAPPPAASQWTTNGTSIGYMGAGGVGIGTTTPTSKLDVAGTITADDLSIYSPNYTAALIESTNAAGTWLNLGNSTAGGRYWKLISTGSGNGEGAGKLIIGSSTMAGTLEHNAMTISENGDIGVGTAAPAAKLDVIGTARVHVLTITGGADVAEPFNINEGTEAERRDGTKEVQPGMVVTIDRDRVGELRISRKAYDKAVAGIISGANGVNPGMVLTQTGSVADGKHPVALTGRVWTWCDADAGGEIVAGDMLTTSDTPGHAMRVSDQSQANGAVIGKAMSSLKSGKGMVLVLVNLQ